MMRACFGVVCGVFLLLMCAVLSLSAWGQAAKAHPQAGSYVSDFAHVMTPRGIAHLNRLCGKVEHTTHDRIDVVTVQSTGGEPIEEYAAQLQAAWKTGPREAMVVVAVGQRQRWIAVQSGLEGVVSRAELNKISGEMVPLLRNNNFDGAMTVAVDELAAQMAASAGVKMKLLLPWGASAVVPEEDRWLQPVTWGLTVLLFASLGVWAYASGLGDTMRRKMSRRTGGQRR